MGVSKNSGTPKWMVYKGKPYEQMDDLGGIFPLFLVQHPHEKTNSWFVHVCSLVERLRLGP